MASIAPWRQLLLLSLEANKHLKHSKYFQLATIKQNGAPAVRTVVFRGFEEGSNNLLITTDARSRKVQEIKSWPMGELLVYFSDTWEQFRISGILAVIGPESSPEQQLIRRKLWDESSPKSLLQFAGPYPGLSISGDQVKQADIDQSAGPLDTFLVVTLEPSEVDYLNLKKEKRLLFETSPSCQWTEQVVNP